MGVKDRLQETWYRAVGRTELTEQIKTERREAAAAQQMVAHLTESMSGLEARMNEDGWQRLTASAEQEFSREGLRQITAVCRLMAIKNPLIKRGLSLRTSYVWGQGVEVSARAEEINEVIQACHDDPGNQRTLFGQQACEELDRALGTDGNTFIALFTSPRTGKVQIRTIPWDEISEVICNPEDASEPWFYQRDWWADETTEFGVMTRRRTALYPALGYRPKVRPGRRPAAHGEMTDVLWDAPLLHVSVGGLHHWKWGVPDAYAAIDWARAYKDFLSDWATIVRALSRFAWKLTSKGSKQAAAKTRLAQAPSRSASGEENFAGATALTTADMALDPIPKTGATIDSESGRPLAAMVAAALDLPVTMLLGDPGVTGARATAATLDTPTERAMDARRAVWTSARRAIYRHIILEAVRAPEGALYGKGTISRDEWGREVVDLRDIDDTIDISWPDLDEIDPATVVKAIVEADSTTYLPQLVVARLLLEALGVSDVDQILDQLTDDNGDFVRPDGGAGGAGQAAVDAFRRGEDPAALMAGEPPADSEPPQG